MFSSYQRSLSPALNSANSAVEVKAQKYTHKHTLRSFRWCFPFKEVLSPCALTLNSMFAEYRLPIHTLGIVAWWKQTNLALPEHPWSILDATCTTLAHTKVKAECLRTHLLILGYVVICYFRLFFQRKKTPELNKSKGPFPFSLLRAEVTSSSEIWYVLMSHSYILTLPPRLTSEPTCT